MSAEAVPPPNPPDSLIYKLRYTPLADILRGRFTHRLDVVRTIAEASLPRPLSALVRETARRTRLWGRERVEVARELIAHFSDGLARGATAASLVRLFGDVGIAARLIRRAKKRNRPLGWRATAITVKICSAIIGIALLAYVAMVARLHSGSVRLSRNYSEEFNQRVRAIPAEQRAWPIYRQAYLALGSWPAGVDGREKPGAADWDLFVKFAESNREAIRLYREAAARPHLGAMLFDPDDRAVELKRPNYSPSDIALEPADNPPLMAASFNELTCIRDGARLLAIEAIAAIDDGDGPTAVQNIEAILRMAEHMAERGAVISALVASGTVMHAQAVVAHALSNAPGSLSDAQWTRVAHVLGGVFGSGSFPLPEEFELRSIQDVIQRVFTDDGAGDGHLAPTASEWMVDGVHFAWPDQPSPGRLGVRVMLPITSSIHVRRRPIQELYDDILRRGIQEARTPLWLVERYRVPVEVGSYRRGRWNPIRYSFGAWFFPTLDRAGVMQQYRTQQRDATLVAISLELYRRKRGGYPPTLDALVPQFLPAVPPDRYDGKPIKYKLVDGRPLLYSVGVNRVDDGGVLPKADTLREANRRAREWIAPSQLPADPAGQEKLRGDWILWPPIED